MPVTAASRHMGTTRMTASGSRQLSYLAASTRYTSTVPRPKMRKAMLPAWTWRKVISVHSKGTSMLVGQRVISLDDGAGADAGRGTPLTAAEGYML